MEATCTTADAAARYIERGLTVVPVPPRSKNPNRPGWERLRITIEEIPRYFDNGQNIGIHLGEPSGWRVDVDLDALETRRVAGRFLPPTLTSGRASAPDSHWWYVCPGAEHQTFTDLAGEMLLELRSTGHLTRSCGRACIRAARRSPGREPTSRMRSGLESLRGPAGN